MTNMGNRTNINGMCGFLKALGCFITFGHVMVWNSDDPNEEDMHCCKCGKKWSIWNNVGV